MKPMPDLDKLLARAKAKGIFGTKMRSVIKQANPAGIRAVVEQQFAVARQIVAAGLVPIIEPEVDIHCPDKAAAEELLKAEIKARLDALPDGQLVMLKLTLPEQDDLYADFIAHPRVLKIVALSGGYSREEANARLARQHGMVASFSRALTEGLTAQQSEAEFDAALDAASSASSRPRRPEPRRASPATLDRRRPLDPAAACAGCRRVALRSSRGCAARVLVEPAPDLAVPDQRVAGLQHPVVLVGEVHEARRHARFCSSAWYSSMPWLTGHAQVALAVHHQRRRIEVRRAVVRRALR